MRIAVAGTHCSGKSTLVEEFIKAHPDYEHEPEPYEWLSELRNEPTAADGAGFFRQLEVCVERLCTYERDANVIAERSPLDFVAYLQALGDDELLHDAVELAAAAMAHVDLLVVLPLNDHDGIHCPPSEDLELREAMNEKLLEIIATDEFDVLRDTRVLEIEGARRARFTALQRALGA